MADACVYVGGGADVDSKASGSILFRTVKIEPAGKGRSFELKTDLAVVKALGSVLRFWINIYFCISGMVITY